MNKGLIFEIRRFTVHDGPGIRTTVFFKGCPLDCWWCHNPESKNKEPEEAVKSFILEGKTFYLNEMIGKYMTVDDVLRELRMDRIFYEESCGGVTFSGGEPLMQPEFLVDILKACKTNSIHTAIDTSGYASQKVLEKVHPFADLFLYDLKIMDETDHIRYTGVSNKIILENLVYLISEKKQVTIRIPVVPGITDTAKNIREIKEFLSHLTFEKATTPLFRISLLPFHTIAKNKYKRFHLENKTEHLKDLTMESVMPIMKEFQEEGFKVKIGS